VDYYEHGNEPFVSIKDGVFLTSWATVRSSRRTLLLGVSRLVGWLVGWLVG